jgi:hypothetical protein
LYGTRHFLLCGRQFSASSKIPWSARRAGLIPALLNAGIRPPLRAIVCPNAGAFDMVEVNSSYYARRTRDSLGRWCEATPDGFIFNFIVDSCGTRRR